MQSETPEAHPSPDGGWDSRLTRRLAVLLAEDSPVTQVLISRLLEKRGHTVSVVAGGAEALDLLERIHFDIVLMDVQMPGMDGFQTTRRIRERERVHGGHIPVVGLTGYVLDYDRQQCIDAGMDSYLAKPFQAPDLFAAIDAALEQPPQAPDVARFVFDEKAALARVEGDHNLLSTLVGLFLDKVDRVVADIDRAVQNRDFRALERAAHSLRGSASNFSAVETVEAARSLESMGRTQDAENAQKVLESLHAALDRLRPALEKVRQT